MGRLTGKTALITAAGQGIGRATALMMQAEGAQVIATDVNPGLLAELTALGLETRHLDVTDPAAIAAAVSALPAPAILFNCAGFVATGTILDCSEEQWAFSMGLNLTAMYRMCRAFLPGMIAQGGGSIINMASSASLMGYGSIVAYSAAKGAIRSMTKSIAMHCQDQGYGIRCNVLMPGAIETPMVQAVLGRPGQEQPVPEGVLLVDALGAPRDVANLVLFLASDEARFLTANEYPVDNGLNARPHH